MSKKVTTGLLLLSMTVSSCSQNRTYLTDEEKSWNPYKKGQILIFESTDYDKDTVRIEALNFGFPDGLGVVEYNESLFVLAKSSGPNLGDQFSELYDILKIVAKTEKTQSYVEHRIELKDTKLVGGQRFYFEDLNKLVERSIRLPLGSFDDVIAIGNKHDYSSVPTAIEIIYWSKTKGYVRFDKYDGTTWKLVEIIESSNSP